MLKHLDLFSGIGGFSLGLESAGLVETVAFCDFEKFCQQVLKKHWPQVPIYGDVKELNYERLKADGIDTIDIITGGYPCQPFSVAGSQKGEQDPRHVWPEMFRLIKELKPTWVIGENVSGHIKLGLDTVLENLESEGYSARTFSISAASVGAKHKRERVWIVGYSTSNGRNESKSNKTSESVIRQSKEGGMLKPEGTSNVENSGRSIRGEQSTWNKKSSGLWSFETPEWSTDTNQIARSSEGAETMADTGTGRRVSQERKIQTRGNGTEHQGWWDVEPDVGRVAHGVSQRVDRLKGLGNSVVPQIPFLLGATIKEMIDNE